VLYSHYNTVPSFDQKFTIFARKMRDMLVPLQPFRTCRLFLIMLYCPLQTFTYTDRYVRRQPYNSHNNNDQGRFLYRYNSTHGAYVKPWAYRNQNHNSLQPNQQLLGQSGGMMAKLNVFTNLICLCPPTCSVPCPENQWRPPEVVTLAPAPSVVQPGW